MGVDNQLMQISDEEAFVKNFKAVYNAMTAKPDCKSRVFSKNVNINLKDIYALNDMIVEKFKSHYEDAGFSINVTVSFRGKDSIEFSSWQAFEDHQFNENYSINAITLIWEYYAKLPQYKVPQKHTLVVKLSDGLRPEEMINLVFAGKLEDFKDIDEEISPVVARVDFVNPLLGEELLALVEKWNEGLQIPENGQSGIYIFMQRHRRKLSYLFSYTSLAIVCLLGITIVLDYLFKLSVDSVINISLEQIECCVYVIFVTIMGCILLHKFVEFLINVFFHMLSMDDYKHVFMISPGDEKKQAVIARHYRSNIKKLVGSIALTFLINFVCTIVINQLLH